MAFSLFVDGLPLEMSWDWLQQIFRGEGDIIDVYVSKKIRRRSDCRFGFVRFRKLEEAKMAVRNLNGVMIREKIMRVSFAKYDKNGRLWTDSFMQEEENESKVGRAVKLREVSNGGRSLKEAVEGMPHNKVKEVWAKNNHRFLEGSGVDMNRKEVEMMKLKEMAWRLADEIFKVTSKEEVIRNIGGVVVEMISEFKKKDFVSAVLDGCRKTGEEEEEVLPVAEEEEQLGVFLEDELVISMLHKDQQAPMPLIGPFDFSKEREGVGQSADGVNPSCSSGGRKQKVGLANHVCSGPLDQNQHLPSFDGAIGLAYAEPESSGPVCPPGFEFMVDVTGLSNNNQIQCVNLENTRGQDSLENEREAFQSFGVSSCSVSSLAEKVPQTPVIESELAVQEDEIEDDLQDEENLVEAQVT